MTYAASSWYSPATTNTMPLPLERDLNTTNVPQSTLHSPNHEKLCFRRDKLSTINFRDTQIHATTYLRFSPAPRSGVAFPEISVPASASRGIADTFPQLCAPAPSRSPAQKIPNSPQPIFRSDDSWVEATELSLFPVASKQSN